MQLPRPPPRATFLIRLIAATFIFACTIQPFFWPLLPKPGIQLEWWQVKWMAELGYYVGCGPVLVALYFDFLGFPSEGVVALYWIAAGLWCWLFFLMLGVGYNFLTITFQRGFLRSRGKDRKSTRLNS